MIVFFNHYQLIMKKIFKLLLLIMTALSSCQKEEIVVPKPQQKPTAKPEKPQEPEKAWLAISPTLLTMQESRAVVEKFKTGDYMGVFTDKNDNVAFLYSGVDWREEQKIEVDRNMDVTAYFPYSKQVTSSESISIDIDQQTDWLYGNGKASQVAPEVKLDMKHAMTLIRVKIDRSGYAGKGLVSELSFRGIYLSAIMNAKTGEVTPEGATGTYKAGGGFVMGDGTVVEAILLPRRTALGAEISVAIDGANFAYKLPEYHKWEAGKIYTYTLSIRGGYNCPVVMDEYKLDVEYWSTFGKTDEIRIMEKKDPNYNWDNLFAICTNYCQYGYDTYRGEGKVFGVMYSYAGDIDFEGEMRFVFMRNGVIKEKFQPVPLKVESGSWGGKAIPCYVTSEPGTYQLVPLFRRKGESLWYKAIQYSGSVVKGCDEEWMYEVLPEAPESLPALRMMELETDKFNSILAFCVPDDKPWGLVYTLSNKSEVALKGEIKAVWSREFKMKSNSYRPSDIKKGAVNDEQWADELGRVSVDIAPGSRFWRGVIQCKFPVKRLAPTHNGVRYAGGKVHLYWRAEGSDEWKLLRCDSDFLFNQSYEGDVWDKTTNFLSILPNSWK